VAGLIGAILGFAALALAKIFLLDGALRDLTDLLTPLLWNEVLLMFPVMAGAGAFVSAVTAWITLRFYLRVLLRAQPSEATRRHARWVASVLIGADSAEFCRV